MNLADLEKLPPEQLKQVLDFAEFLKSKNSKPTFPPGTSAYDLAKDVLGCIDGGPTDFSQDPS